MNWVLYLVLGAIALVCATVAGITYAAGRRQKQRAAQSPMPESDRWQQTRATYYAVSGFATVCFVVTVGVGAALLIL